MLYIFYLIVLYYHSMYYISSVQFRDQLPPKFTPKKFTLLQNSNLGAGQWWIVIIHFKTM